MVVVVEGGKEEGVVVVSVANGSALSRKRAELSHFLS